MKGVFPFSVVILVLLALGGQSPDLDSLAYPRYEGPIGQKEFKLHP